MNSENKLKMLKETELFVLDMDGTIYFEDTPIDGAIAFCNEIYRTKRLLYFTNNASRSPNDYVEKLKKIGYPAERENVVTSGDVTIAYLNRYYQGKSVYLLGTRELEKSFLENGITISENSDIVVVSFDLTLTYEKLSKACTLIRNGAEFFSTHPDINCPVKGGFIPDSGAICEAIAASTGKKPRYFGKPYAETAEMLEQISGINRGKTAMIGDRLYTDIALGKKNGILSILVMTGETTPELLKDATGDYVPDLVYDSVYEILKDI
jgi:Predicted sugar phosphatases of the HAD superfamily